MKTQKSRGTPTTALKIASHQLSDGKTIALGSLAQAKGHAKLPDYPSAECESLHPDGICHDSTEAASVADDDNLEYLEPRKGRTMSVAARMSFLVNRAHGTNSREYAICSEHQTQKPLLERSLQLVTLNAEQVEIVTSTQPFLVVDCLLNSDITHLVVERAVYLYTKLKQERQALKAHHVEGAPCKERVRVYLWQSISHKRHEYLRALQEHIANICLADFTIGDESNLKEDIKSFDIVIIDDVQAVSQYDLYEFTTHCNCRFCTLFVDGTRLSSILNRRYAQPCEELLARAYLPLYSDLELQVLSYAKARSQVESLPNENLLDDAVHYLECYFAPEQVTELINSFKGQLEQRFDKRLRYRNYMVRLYNEQVAKLLNPKTSYVALQESYRQALNWSLFPQSVLQERISENGHLIFSSNFDLSAPQAAMAYLSAWREANLQKQFNFLSAHFTSPLSAPIKNSLEAIAHSWTPEGIFTYLDPESVACIPSQRSALEALTQAIPDFMDSILSPALAEEAKENQFKHSCHKSTANKSKTPAKLDGEDCFETGGRSAVIKAKHSKRGQVPLYNPMSTEQMFKHSGTLQHQEQDFGSAWGQVDEPYGAHQGAPLSCLEELDAYDFELGQGSSGYEDSASTFKAKGQKRGHDLSLLQAMGFAERDPYSMDHGQGTMPDLVMLCALHRELNVPLFKSFALAYSSMQVYLNRRQGFVIDESVPAGFKHYRRSHDFMRYTLHFEKVWHECYLSLVAQRQERAQALIAVRLLSLNYQSAPLILSALSKFTATWCNKHNLSSRLPVDNEESQFQIIDQNLRTRILTLCTFQISKLEPKLQALKGACHLHQGQDAYAAKLMECSQELASCYKLKELALSFNPLSSFDSNKLKALALMLGANWRHCPSQPVMVGRVLQELSRDLMRYFLERGMSMGELGSLISLEQLQNSVLTEQVILSSNLGSSLSMPALREGLSFDKLNSPQELLEAAPDSGKYVYVGKGITSLTNLNSRPSIHRSLADFAHDAKTLSELVAPRNNKQPSVSVDGSLEALAPAVTTATSDLLDDISQESNATKAQVQMLELLMQERLHNIWQHAHYVRMQPSVLSRPLGNDLGQGSLALVQYAKGLQGLASYKLEHTCSYSYQVSVPYYAYAALDAFEHSVVRLYRQAYNYGHIFSSIKLPSKLTGSVEQEMVLQDADFARRMGINYDYLPWFTSLTVPDKLKCSPLALSMHGEQLFEVEGYSNYGQALACYHLSLQDAYSTQGQYVNSLCKAILAPEPALAHYALVQWNLEGPHFNQNFELSLVPEISCVNGAWAFAQDEAVSGKGTPLGQRGQGALGATLLKTDLGEQIALHMGDARLSLLNAYADKASSFLGFYDYCQSQFYGCRGFCAPFADYGISTRELMLLDKRAKHEVHWPRSYQGLAILNTPTLSQGLMQPKSWLSLCKSHDGDLRNYDLLLKLRYGHYDKLFQAAQESGADMSLECEHQGVASVASQESSKEQVQEHGAVRKGKRRGTLEAGKMDALAAMAPDSTLTYGPLAVAGVTVDSRQELPHLLGLGPKSNYLHKLDSRRSDIKGNLWHSDLEEMSAYNYGQEHLTWLSPLMQANESLCYYARLSLGYNLLVSSEDLVTEVNSDKAKRAKLKLQALPYNLEMVPASSALRTRSLQALPYVKDAHLDNLSDELLSKLESDKTSENYIQRLTSEVKKHHQQGRKLKERRSNLEFNWDYELGSAPKNLSESYDLFKVSGEGDFHSADIFAAPQEQNSNLNCIAKAEDAPCYEPSSAATNATSYSVDLPDEGALASSHEQALHELNQSPDLDDFTSADAFFTDSVDTILGNEEAMECADIAASRGDFSCSKTKDTEDFFALPDFDEEKHHEQALEIGKSNAASISVPVQFKQPSELLASSISNVDPNVLFPIAASQESQSLEPNYPDFDALEHNALEHHALSKSLPEVEDYDILGMEREGKLDESQSRAHHMQDVTVLKSGFTPVESNALSSKAKSQAALSLQAYQDLSASDSEYQQALALGADDEAKAEALELKGHGDAEPCLNWESLIAASGNDDSNSNLAALLSDAIGEAHAQGSAWVVSLAEIEQRVLKDEAAKKADIREPHSHSQEASFKLALAVDSYQGASPVQLGSLEHSAQRVPELEKQEIAKREQELAALKGESTKSGDYSFDSSFAKQGTGASLSALASSYKDMDEQGRLNELYAQQQDTLALLNNLVPFGYGAIDVVKVKYAPNFISGLSAYLSEMQSVVSEHPIFSVATHDFDYLANPTVQDYYQPVEAVVSSRMETISWVDFICRHQGQPVKCSSSAPSFEALISRALSHYVKHTPACSFFRRNYYALNYLVLRSWHYTNRQALLDLTYKQLLSEVEQSAVDFISELLECAAIARPSSTERACYHAYVNSGACKDAVSATNPYLCKEVASVVAQESYEQDAVLLAMERGTLSVKEQEDLQSFNQELLSKCREQKLQPAVGLEESLSQENLSLEFNEELALQGAASEWSLDLQKLVSLVASERARYGIVKILEVSAYLNQHHERLQIGSIDSLRELKLKERVTLAALSPDFMASIAAMLSELLVTHAAALELRSAQVLLAKLLGTDALSWSLSEQLKALQAYQPEAQVTADANSKSEDGALLRQARARVAQCLCAPSAHERTLKLLAAAYLAHYSADFAALKNDLLSTYVYLDDLVKLGLVPALYKHSGTHSAPVQSGKVAESSEALSMEDLFAQAEEHPNASGVVKHQQLLDDQYLRRKVSSKEDFVARLEDLQSEDFGKRAFSSEIETILDYVASYIEPQLGNSYNNAQLGYFNRSRFELKREELNLSTILGMRGLSAHKVALLIGPSENSSPSEILDTVTSTLQELKVIHCDRKISLAFGSSSLQALQLRNEFLRRLRPQDL